MNAHERDYDWYVTRPDVGPECSACGENPGEEKCGRCGTRFCPECLESHEREHRETDKETARQNRIDRDMDAAKEARHRR